ncbi:hypothetical protein ANN_07602 [Periplaneta americana]|uniref:DUF4817 domain-containing protein n=1 Tax=Periplaneta americana TaxID=6978 RepID=A0ABQ8SZQ2_PERAM|nr:hypothetical protein ANN_07602 [Periplaneta americana]
MDLREVGYDGRDWINLAQDRDRWRAYEYATIVYVYGLCDGNATAAVLAYQALFPNRRIPSAQIYEPFKAEVVDNNGDFLVNTPPRSPDLTCLDFFLWGEMKQLVYETVVETEEDLVARITVAADVIADMPGIFERTRQSMVRR